MRALRSSLLLLPAVVAVGCGLDQTIESSASKAADVSEQARIVEAAPGRDPKDFTAAPDPGMPRDLVDLQRRTYKQFSVTLGFGGGRMVQPSQNHTLPFDIDQDGNLLDFTKINGLPQEIVPPAGMPGYDAGSPFAGRWTIKRLDLIGTMHDASGRAYDIKPGDYWTMGQSYHPTPVDRTASKEAIVETKTPPMRPLDAFENEALAGLRYGGNILVRAEGDRLHVLGAVRAVSKTCMQCHKAETGQLLGAFSYELKRVGAEFVPKKIAKVEARPVAP